MRLRCDSGKRLLRGGTSWLILTGSAAVESDFKGPHLLPEPISWRDV